MINELIELAKKENIELEVFTGSTKEVVIETLNDSLKNYNEEISKIYSLKAIVFGKTVKLSLENLNNKEEIIKIIKEQAQVIDNDNENRLCENDYQNDEVREKKNIDFNYIKEELLKLNDLKEKYPFIVNINSFFGYYDNKTEIDNSKHHLSDSYDSISAFVYISGQKNDIVKTVSINIYAKEFDIKEIRRKIDEKIDELKLKLEATSIKTDKYNVLLKNNVVKNILSTFLSLFDAKTNYLKLSLIHDKLNKKVFSDKISIIEEPVNKRFIFNKHFDKEGTLTYNKEIVKDGVFLKTINNLEYAIKTNTKPTGNASGVYNMHIVEGKKSYDELVKKLNNGIIISEVNGLHAGINKTTGDISLQSNGFLVENGKITKALDMILISTNILELFNNVDEVGSDLKEFSKRYSSPSLLVNNITISGQEE